MRKKTSDLSFMFNSKFTFGWCFKFVQLVNIKMISAMISEYTMQIEQKRFY